MDRKLINKNWARSMRRRSILVSFAPLALLFQGSAVSLSPMAPELRAMRSVRQSSDAKYSHQPLPSPLEIEQSVNQHKDDADLNAIWEGLGVVTNSGKPGKCGCRGYDCPGTCRAEVISINDSKERAMRTIVRICYGGEMGCWFLLFEKVGDWKYLGVAESVDNKYEPVRHRIVSCGKNAWLVLKAGTGGTGFLGYDERWFLISDKGLTEVLSYPLSGHSVQGEPDDYQLDSKADGEPLGDDCMVIVDYKIFRDPISKPGFSVSQKIQFIWDMSAERFFVDKANSDLDDVRHSPVVDYLSRHGYWK
jgi:hypothetical protein